MKRKMIVLMLLLMAMAALPCFAEIRMKREGANGGSIHVNMAQYWNDKYSRPIMSAKRLLKHLQESGTIDADITAHYYYDHEGFYCVVLDYENGAAYVEAWYYYDDGYAEELFELNFVPYSAAKAKFDSLCQQYYNEIPR